MKIGFQSEHGFVTAWGNFWTVDSGLHESLLIFGMYFGFRLARL